MAQQEDEDGYAPQKSEHKDWEEGTMEEWLDTDSANTNTTLGPLAPGSRGIDPSTLYFKPEDVILLVDDSADTRRYVRSILAPFCTCIEARDGQEALEICTQQTPDLIISDVMMPRLNGWGLLNHLKRGTPEQQMIPFILLTAVDDAQLEGLLAGADDYMVTPFGARELVARAHMQLQLGKKRKSLEKLFDARTAELRSLTDYSPVGILRCSLEGFVTYANVKWYEISGYPSGQPVTNWGDYIMEEHQERIRMVWEAFVVSSDQSRQAEWQWKNGRWCSTQVIRLGNVDEGSTTGFIGSTVDITERKLNEELQRQRVRDAERRREEAEAAKSQQELLIDITSHEIRNPISSLMQCSSLVKTNMLVLQEELQRTLDEGRSFRPTTQLLLTISDDLEALESIYQCALTQERISNDVLSLGKIQLDMLQMFDVETKVSREAQKAVAVFQNEARMKRIDLTLVMSQAFDDLGLDVIMTDPVRLGQVVTNLLSNAIRFTANSHTRHVKFTIDIGPDPPTDGTCCKPPPAPSPAPLKEGADVYLFIAVSDTGPGLTESELAMLFQRFSQASPQTHTIFGGSGLGLFVCRKLCELLGGRIEVVSEYGCGSVFRFFIRARAVLRPRDVRTADAATAALRGATPFTWERGKPHVLVVEDNPINQTVLRRQLRHIGLTVETANNGREALDRIRATMAVDPSGAACGAGTPFDCVLMDLEMPILDGLAATRLLRQDEALGCIAHNVVIALTGNARQAQINEAMADFDDVVVKPYRLDHLLHKIESFTRTQRERPYRTGGGKAAATAVVGTDAPDVIACAVANGVPSAAAAVAGGVPAAAARTASSAGSSASRASAPASTATSASGDTGMCCGSSTSTAASSVSLAVAMESKTAGGGTEAGARAPPVRRCLEGRTLSM